MNSDERRQYLRHETEIGVTVSIKDEQISAMLIDIGQGGIGMISETDIKPGTEVYITIKFIEEYSIQGIIKWSSPFYQDQKVYYRIGVEAKDIIFLSELKAAGLPERSDPILKRFMDT